MLGYTTYPRSRTVSRGECPREDSYKLKSGLLWYGCADTLYVLRSTLRRAAVSVPMSPSALANRV